MPDENHVNATFYHYKLIKKIPVSRLLVRLYLLLPYIAVISFMIVISWTSCFYFVLAAPVMLWIPLCYLPIGSAVIRNTVS